MREKKNVNILIFTKQKKLFIYLPLYLDCFLE
jgi:hypothetical protein